MIWNSPEMLRMELAGLGSKQPYTPCGYMSKRAYSAQVQYNITAFIFGAFALAPSGDEVIDQDDQCDHQQDVN
jgi:hypothetical protein